MYPCFSVHLAEASAHKHTQNGIVITAQLVQVFASYSLTYYNNNWQQTKKIQLYINIKNLQIFAGHFFLYQ